MIGRWLSFAALSGVILINSITGASGPTLTVENQQSTLKSMQTASNKFQPNPYTQIVRGQFKWTSEKDKEPDPKKPTVVQVAIKEKESIKAPAPAVPKQSSSNKSNSSSAKVSKPKPVQTASAPTASVSSKAVSRQSSSNSTLINHALSLIGTPYLFGGTTLKGLDCSAYTQYVFAGSGITLPRTAAEQFTRGTSISRSALLPGDLVFFTTYKPGASHNGIYIGGGNFVHASTKGVKISSLSAGYYDARYIGARRIR